MALDDLVDDDDCFDVLLLVLDVTFDVEEELDLPFLADDVVAFFTDFSLTIFVR